ncbi:hypothetical protein ACFOTA_06935 [Chitinophaga sp. GCM10012297]|uniref:Holin n=1 Tax=Chitinophaga chungangae TaxID=2821488 RepID=A0ABS3YB90_9BACT|nr:hypothetical protein [Chitinophaga chungangae]MBO9151934.1 hypothetical protein [Chitinophaga chungangae]
MGGTKFGVSQVVNTTPKWVGYTMNIIVALAIAGNTWVASTGMLNDADKVEWMLGISILTGFLHYIAKMFGIPVEEPKWKQK